MNIILTGGTTEHAIDEHHIFVTIGQNCWGIGEQPSIALKNCKANAWHGAKLFITRVAPKEGLGIDPIDGSVSWNEKHDAKNCPLCTVGKGIRINTDKSFKE
jgi:hypothetical protein